MFDIATVYATSTSAELTSVISTGIGEMTTVILAVLALAIGLLGALMGFQFGWRWLRKHVGGAK